MKPSQAKPNRRNFLLGATLGTAAAAAAAIVTGKTTEQVSAEVAALTPADTGQSGYRLTPHIAQYYDTTKL